MSSAAPPAGAEPALAIPLSAAGRRYRLPAHAALNVNEGPNAGQAGRAFGAGPLYPVSDALAADN